MNAAAKEKKKAIVVSGDGLELNWKVIFGIVAALMAGSGSIYGFQIATKSDLEKESAKQEQLRIEVNTKQDELIGANTEAIKNTQVVIGEVRFKLNAFEETQNKIYARSEAKRLTENITSREKREIAYDRLVDLNIKRLKGGKEPCANIDSCD